MADLRTILLEAVTRGLPPEEAAAMLLEPSRWNKNLFQPAKDLAAVYKDYSRGEVSIGRLFDLATEVSSSARAMAEIADVAGREYGRASSPEDIPLEIEPEDRVEPDDIEIEVLQKTPGDRLIRQMLDHVRAVYPASLLERLWGRGISREDLVAFENQRFLTRTERSIRDLWELFRAIDGAYKQQNWPELIDLYSRFDVESSGLAGDVMVLRDLADAAVTSGYGEVPVGQAASEGLPSTPAEPTEAQEWRPAVLDREYTDAIRALHTALRQAYRGQLTYAGLQDAIVPHSQPGSPIFRLARRQTRAGAARSPVSHDIEQVRRATGELAPPAEPEVSATYPQPAAAAAEPQAPPAAPPVPELEPAAPQTDLPVRELAGLLGANEASAARFIATAERYGETADDLAEVVRDALDVIAKLQYGGRGREPNWQQLIRQPGNARSVRRTQGVARAALRDLLTSEEYRRLRADRPRLAGELAKRILQPARAQRRSA